MKKLIISISKTAAILAVFFVIKKYYLTLFEIPIPFETLKYFNSDYFNKNDFYYASFFLSALNKIYISLPLFLLTLLISANKHFYWNCDNNDPLYKPTKVFFICLIIIATFFNFLTPFNFYFNNFFWFERLLLIFCGVFFIWYPFLLPFIILLCILFLKQQFIPLGYCSILDKRLFYELPFILLSYLLIPRFFRVSYKYVWVVMLSLIASNYYVSGVGKILLGPHWFSWIQENNLFVHFIFSHQFGWLHYLNNESIEIIAKNIATNEFILCLFTVFIELVSILIGLSLCSASFILILLCAFHFGVFFESGIFFWKWICVLLLTLSMLLIYKKNFKNNFFGCSSFLSILIICLFSKKIYNPVELSWWDPKYNIRFEYFVDTNHHINQQISGHFFAPYEQYFTFQRLYGLVSDQIMTPNIPFSDYYKYKSLQSLPIDQIYQWRDQNKKCTYNPDEVKALSNFIITYFKNYNNQYHKKIIFKIPWIPHLWKDKYAFQPINPNDHVEQFRIVLVEEGIDGFKARETLRKEVFSLSVPQK